MNSFWKGKRVLVTGGAGFIGSFVVDNLIRVRGLSRSDIVVPRSHSCDLRLFENCQTAVQGCQVVIHLAASTGGIAFSRSHPASQYRDCMLMNLDLFEASYRAGVGKVVGLGNILVYAPTSPSPLEESSLYCGKVADSHMGIGMAKRDMVMLCEMYHKQYGLKAVTILSANAYGPRDRFDDEVSHVIPATIVKCHRDKELVVWGDGRPTRDFLYVEDIAEGILLAAEKLEPPDYYLNISSGEEISIADLARLIARETDFDGEIRFDLTKSGGDPRRCASNKRAEELLGFKPKVSIEEGLRRTISWYRERVPVGREVAVPVL